MSPASPAELPLLLLPAGLLPAAAMAPVIAAMSWTVAWLAITHTVYAALDINAGHITMRLGKAVYFYQRYSELALHWLIAVRFLRPDHALMAVWHSWKYVDVTAGGCVAPRADWDWCLAVLY